jgi:hypothetical protein
VYCPEPEVRTHTFPLPALLAIINISFKTEKKLITCFGRKNLNKAINLRFEKTLCVFLATAAG